MIVLREFEGYKIEDASKYKQPTFAQSSSNDGKKMTENYEGVWADDFTAVIEAMHCYPHATGNFTRYMADGCKESLSGWTDPYERPTIMFHNDYDGIVNGRIKKAYMGHSEKSGTDCLMLESSHPDYNTRRDISSGILKTVSIGVAAHDVRCSICGQQLAEGEMCDHVRGVEYDGQICYWDVYKFTPKELSYVIVPSDKYAQVKHIKYSNESGRETPLAMHNGEMKTTEGLQKNNLHTKNKEKPMELEEQLKVEKKLNESLQASKTALENDKMKLTEQITQLTNEKIQLQESEKTLKEQISAKEALVAQEKQLREAQEEENKKLQEEVKTALVDKLTSLRESAGKPKMEKLNERSIESLRDSISDLEAELKESQTKGTKGSAADPTVSDPEPTPASNAGDYNTEDDADDIGLSL